MARLAGKVAFITGGGGGIGRATAERFAAEGAKVAVAEIDEKSGEAAAQSARLLGAKSGGDAFFVRCDVRERQSVEAAMAETVKRFGKLTILHNNAGGSTPQDGPVTEVSEDEFWRVMKLDVFGTFICSKIGIPHIIEAGGGAINNMTSTLALIAVPGRDCYTARRDSTFAGSGICAAQHTRQRHCASGDLIGPGQEADGRFQGHRKVSNSTPARSWPADPHGQYGCIPGIGRGGNHHRANPGGG
jgi:NAD(P)-dependent dehydrogenase (short-subunit alcohol dehydrogenase family)